MMRISRRDGRGDALNPRTAPTAARRLMLPLLAPLREEHA